MKLTGTVVEWYTYKTVPNATVKAAGRITQTDLNGRFTLNIEQGNYQVEVTHPEFDTLTMPVSLTYSKDIGAVRIMSKIVALR